MSAALADLLLSLAGSPALPGARCRGKYDLFDEAQPDEAAHVVEQRHRQAAGLCQRCPSLDRCAEWLDSLPPRQRPPGVTAGRVRAAPPGRGRPRKASA